MKRSSLRVVAIALYALLACALSIAEDDDETLPAATTAAAGTTLTTVQRDALGIVVARPHATQIPDQVESMGLVLDPAVLVSDLGDLAASEAASRSARAEVNRLQGLYGGSAGASLKMLEAARVEEVKAAEQSRLTETRFAQRWTPLVRLSSTDRRALATGATRGDALLLRVDLPGRHSLGVLPQSAELDVDGVQVHGRVFGLLRETDETQSIGVLVGVEHAPAGLGAGARVPVSLQMGNRSGVALPRDAVLYDEHGPYVYKQLTAKQGGSGSIYERCDVKLLLRRGGSWLVNGVDGNDDIVVEGAAVIWSLQGPGGHVVDDDDG